MRPFELAPAVLVPLVIWRIYRKFRKNIGPQRFKVKRTWLKLVFFLLILVAVGSKAPPETGKRLFLGAGLAGGILAAIVSGRFTQFERTEAGVLYTPNPHIGVAVALALVGCMVYRLLAARNGGDPSDAFASALLGVALGYYVAYAAVLLVKHYGVREAERPEK